jgi:hypothetical protein
MFIPDLDPEFFPGYGFFSDPGVKKGQKAPDPDPQHSFVVTFVVIPDSQLF